MLKGLRIIVIPTAVIILTLGLILPVFSIIQEERCHLAFSAVIGSSLVSLSSLDQAAAEYPREFEFLLKHPRQTLKRCIAYESENADGADHDLLKALGASAYAKITGKDLPGGSESLTKSLMHENPEFYEKLISD